MCEGHDAFSAPAGGTALPASWLVRSRSNKEKNDALVSEIGQHVEDGQVRMFANQRLYGYRCTFVQPSRPAVLVNQTTLWEITQFWRGATSERVIWIGNCDLNHRIAAQQSGNRLCAGWAVREFGVVV